MIISKVCKQQQIAATLPEVIWEQSQDFIQNQYNFLFWF